MYWRSFFLLAFIVASIAAIAEERPNLVLYVADDWGINDAGCYGNTAIQTPGLDALAEHGVRFTNAFSTCASCSASRSVILSGMHTHSNGMYGHAHSTHHFSSFDTVESLPNLLRDAGYRTMCAGKYHVAQEEVYHFDEYIGVKAPEEMADLCTDFIKNNDAPFFLYFCTVEPHRPFKREGSREYDPAEVIVPDYLPDIPEVREELAQYYGSVERADRGLVRLQEMLKAAGKWENTVILFISDNGIAFPGAKTNLYEPGIHLPLVLRDPSQEKQGGENKNMVSWLDITPTLLDYADAVPEKPKYQGRSFRGIIGAKNAKGWDKVYASQTFHEITMYYPMRVVRTNQYKLIWNIAHRLEYPFASDLWDSITWQAMMKKDSGTLYGPRSIDTYIHRPEFELYDVRNDAQESRNLAENPEFKAVLEALRSDLQKFQQETGDPWYIKWQHE